MGLHLLKSDSRKAWEDSREYPCAPLYMDDGLAVASFGEYLGGIARSEISVPQVRTPLKPVLFLACLFGDLDFKREAPEWLVDKRPCGNMHSWGG